MSKEQNWKSSQNAAIKKAIDFAYDNIPDLKRHQVVVNIQDCSAKRVIHRQRAEGPSETMNVNLLDEEWEVSIPVKVFSSLLIITVYRYHDGSLDVTNYLSRPP